MTKTGLRTSDMFPAMAVDDEQCPRAIPPCNRLLHRQEYLVQHVRVRVDAGKNLVFHGSLIPVVG